MSNTWGLRRSDRSFLSLGTGLIVPVQQGARVGYPPRYQSAAGVSNNVFDFSYFRGLAYPTLQAPVDVTSDWFTASLINSIFITRGASVGVGFDDLAEIAGPVAYSDGHVTQTLLKAKGSMLSFGARQNEQLRCTIGIMGTDRTTAAWSTGSAPTPNALQRASFADVTFTSGVHGVTEFNMSIQNNLRPNPIIGEGSGSAVVENNAGRPELVLDVTVDASGTFPVNEGSIVFSINPPAATGPVVFTASRIRIDNPDDIATSGERVSQQFRCVCLSADGVAFPISVA